MSTMHLKPAIARAILEVAYPTPTLTLVQIAETIRSVVRDPIDAEHKVGVLYGHVFKRKEMAYDAANGSLFGMALQHLGDPHVGEGLKRASAATRASRQPPSILIDPEHPAWKAIDDDDWNYSTLSAFLHRMDPATRVTVVPGNHPKDLVDRLTASIARFAFVTIQRVDR